MFHGPCGQETGWRARFCVVGAFTFIIPSYVGWITGMYLFLSYSFNIIIGPTCDSYGPETLGPISCKTHWQFMLCLGILGAMGGAATATIAISVIAKVFTRRRGLAMGVALTGFSVGSIIIPIMLQSTIIAIAITEITAMGLLCFLPYSHLVRVQRSSTAVTMRNLFNFSAFRSPSFLFVSFGLFLLEFAIFAIAGLLPTLATGAGFPPGAGYILIAILSASSCVGRILLGMVGDIISPFNVILAMAAFTLLFMGTLFIPFAEKSKPTLYAFSALWGTDLAVFMGATCETRNYGRFYGTMTFMISFGVLHSLPLSGVMLENLGRQSLAGSLTAIVFLGGYVISRLGDW
ncbi:major facilitator superfamily domain-containing protein [Aspergillus alliaceus]|uniref:major facilitator superfamily domain-containing protein n=1 Tax=Petromyces alliaceus TaxID=209559 RepID=UPI0012A5A686|nr:major facilitator superfamily domain-containing protein [Aspergillus alliaceus]KAB8239039.1 major facilitator superfamily domain-containing protein [Aspergillus alliaceus]